MTFLERFAAAPLAAEPASFQLLFNSLADVSADALTTALRNYHPSLAAATAELVPSELFPVEELGAGPKASIVGLVEWADHTIKLLGCDSPMPPSAVEGCLKVALLPQDILADARQHQAHILLYYAGHATDPLDQRIALAAVAGCLALFGAIVTLNEEARAAVASFTLLPDDDGEDMLDTLRKLPMPFLYGGFAKMKLTDVPGVWMRTFACPRLGLPNLAYHAPTGGEGERIFHLFSGILNYLRETGLSFEPNELIGIDENTTLKLREPTLMEWWLESRGPLWVLVPVEFVGDK